MHCAQFLERQREAWKGRSPGHHAVAARRQVPTAFRALEKQRLMARNRLALSNLLLLLPTPINPGAQHPPRRRAAPAGLPVSPSCVQ